MTNTDKTNSALLYYACRYSTQNIIEYIISLGFDINTKLTKGNTALHLICKRMRNVTLVKYMIEDLKADITIKNDKQLTPVQVLCVDNFNIEILTYFIENGMFDEKAIYTFDNSNGENTDIIDTKLPIHFICTKCDDLAFYVYLKSKNINLNIPDSRGWKPIHYVSTRLTNTKILDYLIDQCGSNIHDTNNDGWNPLHLACRYNKANIVIYLIFKGGNIDIPIQKYMGDDTKKYRPIKLLEINVEREGKVSPEEYGDINEIVIQMNGYVV